MTEWTVVLICIGIGSVCFIFGLIAWYMDEDTFMATTPPHNIRHFTLQQMKEAEDELHRQTSTALYGGSVGQSYHTYTGTQAPSLAQQLAQQNIAQQRAIAAQQAWSNALAQQVHGIGIVPQVLGLYPLPKHEGIRIGEIIAWRAWRIEKGFLQSASVGTIWAPGEPMEGDVKQHGCYSYKKKYDALNHMIKEMGTWPCVVGSVQIWGEIVEHELGYRSQFAKINSLDYMTDITGRATDKDLMELKRKYLP